MNEIYSLLESKEPFTICFEFILSSGEKLFLTSAGKKIQVNNKHYYPYSGLNLNKFAFNDSAHNCITISGIFEKEGINILHDLDSAIVSIYFYFINKKMLFEWITYTFSKIEHDGLQFTITLTSEIFKLDKSILQNYSKSCRANFGDNKCKIDITAYEKIYDVLEISGARVKISNCSMPDGFYLHGSARFENNIYDIIKHVDDNITLSKILYCDNKKDKKIILTPGCDKNITTCCNKYGNAINFRGEPFIP